MSIVYYFLYSLNSMMDLASLKDSKSPNPQWGTSEKGSRIIIAPPFVYIHSISLSLRTVLYVDIVSPQIICYTPILHVHAFTLLVHYFICYLPISYLFIVCYSL